MLEKIKFVGKLLLTAVIVIISFYVFRGFYNFCGQSWFSFLIIIPLASLEIRGILALGWDIFLPGGMDSSALNEADIYLSGDSYRIERYKQAKRQEDLLREQNSLLRETQRMMKEN